MAENVNITESGTTPIAADEIGGAKYQRIKLVHGANDANDGDVARTNPLPIAPSYQYQSDTKTTNTAGTAVNATLSPKKYFSMQVTRTAGAATYIVELEGSLDGVTYTALGLQITEADNGKTIALPAPAPVNYFRSNTTALNLTGSTNIVVNVLGAN